MEVTLEQISRLLEPIQDRLAAIEKRQAGLEQQIRESDIDREKGLYTMLMTRGLGGGSLPQATPNNSPSGASFKTPEKENRPSPFYGG